MGACIYSLLCFGLKPQKDKTRADSKHSGEWPEQVQEPPNPPQRSPRPSAVAQLHKVRFVKRGASPPLLLPGPGHNCAPQALPSSPRARWPPGTEPWEARGGGLPGHGPRELLSCSGTDAWHRGHTQARGESLPRAPDHARIRGTVGGLSHWGSGCRTWIASDPRSPSTAFPCSLLAGSATGSCR